MNRARGARKPFDIRQARQRLIDARQFLEAGSQAGYESADLSAADAASCVRWARQLLDAARLRIET